MTVNTDPRHLGEFAILTPIQPDPTQAPSGYVVENPPPNWTDEFGREVPCPARVDMLPADDGQPQHTTKIVTAVKNPAVGFTYEQIIESGNRSHAIDRWRTRIKDANGNVLVDVSWLAVGDAALPPTGSAFQLNERTISRWNDPDTYLHRNPNMAGSGLWEAFGFPEPTDPNDRVRHYGGAPIFYIASQNPPEHFAGVNPVDFNGDPGNFEHTNHGGDNEHPTWWWLDREIYSLRPNWRSSYNTHRIDGWFYEPSAYDNEGVDAPVLHYLAVVRSMIGRFFDQAFVLDLKTQGLYVVPNFAAPDDLTAWNHEWDFNRTRRIEDGVSDVSVTPSGYVAVILYHSASGFAVAIADRLRETDTDANVNAASGVDEPNYMELAVGFGPGSPSTPDTNSLIGVGSVSKSLNGRPAGWLGRRSYVLTGFLPDVSIGLQKIMDDGDLDAFPRLDLPAKATKGTCWPPWDRVQTSEMTRPANVIVLTGQSQCVVGFFEQFQFDQDPATGKLPERTPMSSANPISTIDPKLRVFNPHTRAFEPLDLTRNAAGWGDTIGTTWGLHVSLARELLDRFDDLHLVVMPYTGSAMTPTMLEAAASWSADVEQQVRTVLDVTVTPGANHSAVFTAAAGAFSGLSPSRRVQISGSKAGLTLTGVKYPTDGPPGGNNTHHGRSVVCIAVASDGSSITLVGVAGSGVNWDFAAEGPVTLTFTFGPVSARQLMFETAQQVAEALLHERRTPMLRLHVVHQGETDIDQGQIAYSAALRAHVEDVRSLPWGGAQAEPPPCGIIELSPHTPTGTDEQVAAIIAAQRQVADEGTNIFTIPGDKVRFRLEDGPWPAETRQQNGIHIAPSSALRLGELVDEALDRFAQIPRHRDGSSIDPATATARVAAANQQRGGTSGSAIPTTSSPAEIVAAIDLAIHRGLGVASWQVNGRAVTLRGMDELLRARAYYAKLVTSSTVSKTQLRFE